MLHRKFLTRRRSDVDAETELAVLLEDALDGLEMMVEQYLYVENAKGTYDHAFMAAGEFACQVLSTQRPLQWELTPTGVRYLGWNNVG